jgi:signal transduction histidine kinase
LSNAIKYNAENGNVTIDCQQMGSDKVRISVTDDGIGIAPEHKFRLFEPFQRLGQEAGTIEGTGIGLTISKRLVQLLGGDIGYESQVGKGSTFWVILPLREVEAQAA